VGGIKNGNRVPPIFGAASRKQERREKKGLPKLWIDALKRAPSDREKCERSQSRGSGGLDNGCPTRKKTKQKGLEV